MFQEPRKISKSDYWLRHVCLSVRPSVHTEQLGAHWKDFHEFCYLRIFRKPVDKMQLRLKSDHKSGTLHEQLWNLWQYFAQYFSEWEMFQTKLVNKTKAHILFTVLFSNNGTVYEILCKNMVRPRRLQMATQYDARTHART